MQTRRRFIGISAAVILALSAPGAIASPILYTNAFIVPPSGNPPCNDSGTTYAECTETVQFYQEPFPGWVMTDTGTLSGIASADFGSLSTTASVLFNYATYTFGGWTGATASFSDELLVEGGSGSGYIQYLFDGYIQDGGGNRAISASYFTFSQDGSAPQGVNGSYNGDPTAFVYESTLIPFVWDSPFTVTVTAYSSAGTDMGDSSGRGATTVRLVGFKVFDANGDPVSNYNIYSYGGGSYATPVPEPTTLELLGVAFCGLWAFRRHVFLNRRCR